MQCLILAGGLGTRMQGVADGIAKTLVPVAGRPFCDHQLTWLSAQGVRHIVYAIGHRGAQIRDFVGDGARWGLEVEYIDEGERLLGTGGAVRRAVDLAGNGAGIEGGFLVLYGDSYLTTDVGAVWAASGGGAFAVMSVMKNTGRWDASNAVLESGMVTAYEKGRTDAAAIGMEYIDYGLSVLTPEVVRAHIPAREVRDLADVFQPLAAAGRLRGFEAADRFYEIGSPEGLADLENFLAAP
ncbi:MAG: NTP transferase domain-containing protein [Rhodospirillales bacterium]|nr:NTP transferase domain-containing protein [Rhodospirillales bacterium]